MGRRAMGLIGKPGTASPTDDPRPAADDGYVLPVVIWTVGLLAMLTLAVVARTRDDAFAAANERNGTQAEFAARSAIDVVVAAFRSGWAPSDATLSGTPISCSLPGGEPVSISIEDEAGKLDLNAASRSSLQYLLERLGVDAPKALRLSTAIVEFRTLSTSSATDPDGVKHALFQSVYELGEIRGMDRPLLGRLLRLVTVDTADAGVDPALAPRALRALLPAAGTDAAKESDIPVRSGRSGVYRIRATAFGGAGSAASLTAIVRTTAARHGSDGARTVEWRGAASVDGNGDGAANRLPSPSPPC
ncbi:MAG: general secretion pathway protein GspK [Hyphomicrobiales bacterium]|nr:general secretion pathway protein GspK [Hyphomicrobiales bacterium]MDE2017575.1 general secretion pathway protein GspK [Hyphomicrobiales bacterium]